MPEAVLKKEGRWSSDAFMGYVRANMEDPIWVSDLSGVEVVEYERQPGHGARWGGKYRYHVARRYNDRLGTAISAQNGLNI